MADKKTTTPLDKAPPNTYGFWAPRCWHGMLFRDWMRLLIRNRLAIRPAAWGLTFTVTCFAAFNSIMRRVQE